MNAFVKSSRVTVWDHVQDKHNTQAPMFPKLQMASCLKQIACPRVQSLWECYSKKLSKLILTALASGERLVQPLGHSTIVLSDGQTDRIATCALSFAWGRAILIQHTTLCCESFCDVLHNTDNDSSELIVLAQHRASWLWTWNKQTDHVNVVAIKIHHEKCTWNINIERLLKCVVIFIVLTLKK